MANKVKRKDLLGKRIRLLKPVSIQTGHTFPVGTVFTILSIVRSRYNVCKRETAGSPPGIDRLHRTDFEVIR